MLDTDMHYARYASKDEAVSRDAGSAALCARMEDMRLALGLLPESAMENPEARSVWDVDLTVMLAKMNHAGAELGICPEQDRESLRPALVAPFTVPDAISPLDMVVSPRGVRVHVLDGTGAVHALNMSGDVVETHIFSLPKPSGLFLGGDGEPGVFDRACIERETMTVNVIERLGLGADVRLVAVAGAGDGIWAKVQHPKGGCALAYVDASFDVQLLTDRCFEHPTGLFTVGNDVVFGSRMGELLRAASPFEVRPEACQMAPSPLTHGCGSPWGMLLLSGDRLSLVDTTGCRGSWRMSELEHTGFIPRRVGMIRRDGRDVLLAFDPNQGAGMGMFLCLELAR